MKREELLYQIEEEASYQKLIDVLRAVVELHTPRSSGPFEFCFECNGWDEEDGTEYPCPTIQAIERELE